MEKGGKDMQLLCILSIMLSPELAFRNLYFKLID
jgi:hypothetical protein